MELVNIKTCYHATVDGKKDDYLITGLQQIHADVITEALQNYIEKKHNLMKNLRTKKKISKADQEQINTLINQYTSAQVIIKSIQDSTQI
ncbi:MAG: hypothetical protein WC707_06865 [Candidatus Babeliaceae bacterium]|jgi:hypothetical protein